MKKMSKRLQDILGSRKIWAIIFVVVCISVYLISTGAGMPPISVPIIAVLFLLSTVCRVNSFGGNGKTFWWILLPPVFVIACLLLKERSGDDQPSANAKIKEVFVGATFTIFFLTLGSIYLLGKWQDRNKETSADTPGEESNVSLIAPSYDECYKKGVEYFAEIGVFILTTFPDEGKFATDVAKERCRRSTFAFGS